MATEGNNLSKIDWVKEGEKFIEKIKLRDPDHIAGAAVCGSI